MYKDSCKYKPIQEKKVDFEIVQKDENSGYGVVSHRSFNKGDLIAVLTGEIIHDIRQHSLQIEPGVHLYDIHFSGYFLHSCSPNVFLDMMNMRVYATRKIKVGDYLYMDYAQTEDVLYRQFPCSCGADNCRGWITGKKEPINETDSLYQAFLQSRVSTV